MSKLSILTKGILKENPVLVLLLGTCPALAVSTQAENAIGMGAATMFVLLGSNILVSLLRNIIPDKVRIPCFIVFIASFTTIAEMLVDAFSYSLYQSLGIFLPLITVNCTILARAEMFASKNGVRDSVLDALGSGVGFTLALLAIATIREILGAGSWFGIALPWLKDNSAAIFTLAPGGFLVYAFLIAIINKVTKNRPGKKQDFSCETCPSAVACGKAPGIEEGA